MGGITLPNFKTYHIGTVIRTVQYWWRDRHTDQWNRIQKPEIDPHKYGEIIFDKVQKQLNEGNTAFSINGAGAVGHPQVKDET